MTYGIVITSVGLAKLAAANAGGPAVSLTTMALGDGNGNDIDITTAQAATALVRQVYAAQINALYISTADPTIMMAELLVPSATGGFTIREIGVYDATGALFAYGNFPDTYKPGTTDNTTMDMSINIALKVGNSSDVQLVIDTSIVAATRAWVISTITAAYLIPGGLVGQVLTKQSNANGDFVWVNPSAAVNIVVDSIKEVQTSSAGQTIFTLATITTEGTAVYVEGVRQSSFTILNATQIQLPTALTAGLEVMFVQNEPTEPINIRRLIIANSYYMGQM